MQRQQWPACLVAPSAGLGPRASACCAGLWLCILPQHRALSSVQDSKTLTEGHASLTITGTFETFQVSSRCSEALRSRSGSEYFANSASQLDPAGCGLAKPCTGRSLRPCLFCWGSAPAADKGGPAGSAGALLLQSLSSIALDCYTSPRYCLQVVVTKYNGYTVAASPFRMR